MGGYTKQCKACGTKVWETYPGAHTETSELGEDYCDDCERKEVSRRAKLARQTRPAEEPSQRAWETAMGMRGYMGSPAEREARREGR